MPENYIYLIFCYLDSYSLFSDFDLVCSAYDIREKVHALSSIQQIGDWIRSGLLLWTVLLGSKKNR